MKRMLLSVVAAGLAGLFGEAAEATVSLTFTASGDFTPGSVITLETRVTADAGETDDTIFGSFLYPESQVDPGTMSQNLLPGAGWVPGNLDCTTLRCNAFSAINSILPTPPPPNVTDFLLATSLFTIELDELPGSVIAFDWLMMPVTRRLDFFGVTNTPNFTPGVSITVVPEPTTAVLLGLGLCGLAAAGRRAR